jgi:diguanylate cyclase (GGDEF)-like protein/PAS domain S-box-containing protein
MKHQVTALLSRAAGGDRSTHWGLSLLALLAYFPLAIAAHALVGNVALAMAFIPALVWAIPNYYLFIALDAMSTDQETLQLVASHLVIGTLAYIVGYGYSLRRELSRQLEERQRSDARFRGLFENTSDGVFFLSTDLQILDLNNQAASMLGYEAAELIGMDYHQIVVGKEQEDLNQRLKEVLSGKMLPIYQRDFVRKDGSVLSADVNASLIYDRHGSVYHVQSICRDITERKAAEEQLFYKATHDELTGLFNRAMLFTLLDQTITAAQRNDQRFATLFLDLDGFKKVNDSRGHALGDLLLKECAHRLRSLLRGSDILARLGGDEFAVILVPVDDRAFALKVAEKITAALSLPFDLQGEKSLISASVGVSMFPQQAHTSEDLLKLADQDMYQVKQAKYANPKPAASTR